MKTTDTMLSENDKYEEPTEIEKLQERIEYLELNIRDDDERYDEIMQRYDKAFEELCKILNISCWTGCQICFGKK